MVNALLKHFGASGQTLFDLQLDKDSVVIKAVRVEQSQGPSGASEAITVEERGTEMRAWLESIATPAGLSDKDISAEAIYSPDR
jgi:hypothetical protein